MSVRGRVRGRGAAAGALALWAVSVRAAGGAAVPPAHAQGEIVVAMRYLLPSGTSHSHLYLYRQDGNLLRQLTRADTGQDSAPIFSPDGETIVFTREQSGRPAEFWSVRPRGGDLHRLPAAPAWYTDSRNSPFFTNVESASSPPPGADPPPRYRAPDGSAEIILRVNAAEEDDQYDQPGHGRHYLLRDLRTGRETEMGRLPGFQGLWEVLYLNGAPAEQHFLFEGPLRVAFFGLHLDSTAGDTTFALDLSGSPRLVRLSPNGATPFPLPGEPAFLTLTSERYVPLPGTQKTANSTYVERWDAALKRTRYARAGAAVCYGASLYRPGRTPAVVTVRTDGADR